MRLTLGLLSALPATLVADDCRTRRFNLNFFESEWPMMIFRSVLLASFFVAGGQAQTCERQIVFDATDTKTGARFKELTFEALGAEFKGKPITIVSLEKFGPAPRVIILLDTSGSMTSSEKFSTSLMLASGLISFLDPTTEIAVGRYGDSFTLLTGLTTNRNAIVERVRQQMPDRNILKGQTAMYDALSEALKLLTPVRLGDAIVVIGDGGDNRSRDPVKVRQRLYETPLRIYAMGVFTDIRASMEEIRGPYELAQLTDPTGGRLFTMTDTDRKEARRHEAYTLAQMVADSINSAYAVRLRLPVDLDKPSGWKLFVDRKQHKQLKNVQLFPPQKLQPCAAMPVISAH
jgi:hypothetical protein